MQDTPETTDAPSLQQTVSNPWVQGSASLGVTALAIGVLLAVLGGPSGYADDAGPAVLRLIIGASLSVLGLGLLLSALIIVGVAWNLRSLQAK